MPTVPKVFVDTNIFVALLDKNDPTHQKALSISRILARKKVRLYTSSDVLGETLTVISRKLGKSAAKIFWQNYQISGIGEILVDSVTHRQARELFFKVKSKNISFIDCSSVAAMKRLGIKKIFSFDRHFKTLGLIYTTV